VKPGAVVEPLVGERLEILAVPGFLVSSLAVMSALVTMVAVFILDGVRRTA
jgi:hypothetical protein